MTPRRHTLPAIALAALLGAGLSGCASNTSSNPTPSIASASGNSAATSTPSPSTPDPAASERLDRQNAEDTWRQFNSLLNSLQSLPADQIDTAIAAVAVDPTASSLKTEDAQFRAQHKASFGSVVSSITWPQPIGGGNTAVLMDCQDGSQAGVIDATTGRRLVVGTKDTPFRGTLVRTPAGWRVQTAELLQGQTCTPAA